MNIPDGRRFIFDHFRGRFRMFLGGGPTNALLCADVGRGCGHDCSLVSKIQRAGKVCNPMDIQLAGKAVPKRRNAAAALFRALRKCAKQKKIGKVFNS